MVPPITYNAIRNRGTGQSMHMYNVFVSYDDENL
jgi:hypothetical protein